MGWISDRHMKSGGSVNRSRRSGSDKGPLRLIVAILRHGEGMFDHDYVEFECGHEGSATTGARRGRCAKCKKQTADASGK